MIRESAIARRAAVTTADPRWRALVLRNAAEDCDFYYSVESTGVYCRAGCGARLPRPENVRFHSSSEDAERAGFRPCRRCRPDACSVRQRHAGAVEKACRLIDDSDEIPALEQLSAHVGMSACYFHRIFKAVIGVTPRQYAVALQVKRLKKGLKQRQTVTDAMYGAGFNSPGRLYDRSNRILGMTPTEFRRGGGPAAIRFAVGECAVGSILVAASDRGICAIFIGEEPDRLLRDLQDEFPAAELIGGDTAFEQVVAQVVGFIEAPGREFNLPLDIRGTAFRQQVWCALQTIPFGSTVSYEEIAAGLGAPHSARAVAGACAANRIAVAIPCHRVVRKDGTLSGYRWGVERKAELLKLETSSR